MDEDRKDENDGDLVLLSLSGDERAFARLVERHSSRVYFRAYRLLMDRERAEDVTQETFVNAYEGLEKLREPQAFGRWIVEIAARRAMVRMRDQDRERRAVSTYAQEKKAAGSGTIDSRTTEILHEVGKLAEKYAKPFLMRYLEGLSHEEIAVRLDLTEDNVRQRIHRARKALRTRLKEVTK